MEHSKYLLEMTEFPHCLFTLSKDDLELHPLKIHKDAYRVMVFMMLSVFFYSFQKNLEKKLLWEEAFLLLGIPK